ncbi:uncharacterized protein [Aegilops tauschii subsp. strangulata]|uniref:uncharacterized protein n=1 Tax=Aegilops tauschii subsp. strangulata TaxID=200361 RepID=UPI00098B4C77|nr:uncharacterized protein LOC109751309 [Aegilops tauschii subsp. strangulata]XP_020165790.1 uncharacterized protein LOC109751309 [Aegilops tauschii subsp. strangulata]
MTMEREAREREVIAPVPAEGLSNREVELRALGEALELVALEQDLERDRLEMMERQVMTVEAALTSREAKVQTEIDGGIAGGRQDLAKDYREKLKLEETLFYTRRNELKAEIDGLGEWLAWADKCQKAALDAQAAAKAELASLYQQVANVASLVERATDEANRARGMQHTQSVLFQDLEHRANCALRSICKESVSSPLMPDDAGYLAFFTRVVERLEGSAEKVRQLVDEESRDLLARASTRVFSHLLRSDPDFDFQAVIDPVPRTIHDALGEWAEDHVDDLITRFTSDGLEDQHGAEEHGAAISDDDDASP